MIFRRSGKTPFWLCFLCFLAVGKSHEYALNREPKGEGIFEDQTYDDPIGELTEHQRRTFAYAPQETPDNDEVSEDESQKAIEERNTKEWFLEEINNYRAKLNSQGNEPAEHDAVQRETDEDREALLREENRNEKQQENKKRTKKSTIPLPGQLFEEDIVMSDHLRTHVMGMNTKRDALVDKDYLWEKKGDSVRVPYDIDDNFNEEKRERLKAAIADFHSYTCINFVPKTGDDADYLHFFSNKSMCYSSVGKQGGKQKISIGDGCERKGTLIHEMLHSIGFIHEQSRPDRDKFVKVVWDNIKKEVEHNFEKYPDYLVSNLNITYDFDSVLHYNNHAFSKNGEDTLVDKLDPTRVFGQRDGFSKRNVEQVNKLYDCKDIDPKAYADIPYE